MLALVQACGVDDFYAAITFEERRVNVSLGSYTSSATIGWAFATRQCVTKTGLAGARRSKYDDPYLVHLILRLVVRSHIAQTLCSHSILQAKP